MHAEDERDGHVVQLLRAALQEVLGIRSRKASDVHTGDARSVRELVGRAREDESEDDEDTGSERPDYRGPDPSAHPRRRAFSADCRGPSHQVPHGSGGLGA